MEQVIRTYRADFRVVVVAFWGVVLFSGSAEAVEFNRFRPIKAMRSWKAEISRHLAVRRAAHAQIGTIHKAIREFITIGDTKPASRITAEVDKAAKSGHFSMKTLTGRPLVNSVAVHLRSNAFALVKLLATPEGRNSQSLVDAANATFDVANHLEREAKIAVFEQRHKDQVHTILQSAAEKAAAAAFWQGKHPSVGNLQSVAEKSGKCLSEQKIDNAYIDESSRSTGKLLAEAHRAVEEIGTVERKWGKGIEKWQWPLRLKKQARITKREHKELPQLTEKHAAAGRAFAALREHIESKVVRVDAPVNGQKEQKRVLLHELDRTAALDAITNIYNSLTDLKSFSDHVNTQDIAQWSHDINEAHRLLHEQSDNALTKQKEAQLVARITKAYEQTGFNKAIAAVAEYEAAKLASGQSKSLKRVPTGAQFFETSVLQAKSALFHYLSGGNSTTAPDALRQYVKNFVDDARAQGDRAYRLGRALALVEHAKQHSAKNPFNVTQFQSATRELKHEVVCQLGITATGQLDDLTAQTWHQLLDRIATQVTNNTKTPPQLDEIPNAAYQEGVRTLTATRDLLSGVLETAERR